MTPDRTAYLKAIAAHDIGDFGDLIWRKANARTALNACEQTNQREREASNRLPSNNGK